MLAWLSVDTKDINIVYILVHISSGSRCWSWAFLFVMDDFCLNWNAFTFSRFDSTLTLKLNFNIDIPFKFKSTTCNVVWICICTCMLRPLQLNKVDDDPSKAWYSFCMEEYQHFLNCYSL